MRTDDVYNVRTAIVSRIVLTAFIIEEGIFSLYHRQRILLRVNGGRRLVDGKLSVGTENPSMYMS